MEEVLGGSLVLSDAETIAAIHAVRHLLSLGYQCSPWSKGYIKCIKCSLNTMFSPKLTKSSSCSRLWPEGYWMGWLTAAWPCMLASPVCFGEEFYFSGLCSAFYYFIQLRGFNLFSSGTINFMCRELASSQILLCFVYMCKNIFSPTYSKWHAERRHLSFIFSCLKVAEKHAHVEITTSQMASFLFSPLTPQSVSDISGEYENSKRLAGELSVYKDWDRNVYQLLCFQQKFNSEILNFFEKKEDG